jgi:hypothetical protein
MEGPFCSQCGEAAVHDGDLSLKHLLHDFAHEFTHLDGKIWRSIFALLFQPGRLTKEYWEGRRGLWVRPLRLYLVFYLLHILLAPNAAGPLGIRFGIRQTPKGPEIAVGTNAERSDTVTDDEKVSEVQHVYKIAQYASLSLFAAGSMLLFRRRQPYFGAHLIFAMHVYSFANILMGSFSAPRFQAIKAALGWLTFLYLLLALHRIYGETWFRTFWRAGALMLILVVAELVTVFAVVLVVYRGS